MSTELCRLDLVLDRQLDENAEWINAIMDSQLVTNVAWKFYTTNRYTFIRRFTTIMLLKKMWLWLSWNLPIGRNYVHPKLYSIKSSFGEKEKKNKESNTPITRKVVRAPLKSQFRNKKANNENIEFVTAIGHVNVSKAISRKKARAMCWEPNTRGNRSESGIFEYIPGLVDV